MLKNVLFEHSYLNEKIMQRNTKNKCILYPAYKKKQILNEVLSNLWSTYASKTKRDLDLQTERHKQDNQRLDAKSKLNEEELLHQKKVKELNMDIIEQKTHHIAFLEMTIKEMKEEILEEYMGLPPDLNQAKKRIYEMEQAVKLLSS
jgi:hypothetical protein